MKHIYRIAGCIILICGFGLTAFSVGTGDTSQTENTETKYVSKYKYIIGIHKREGVEEPSYHLNFKRDLGLSGEGDDKGIPVSFTGSFRFHARWRQLYENYDYLPGHPEDLMVRSKNLEIGGFGDSDRPLGGTSPMLNLVMNLTPAPGFDLSFGLGLTHIFAGTIDPDSTRGRMTFGQTFGAVASYQTKFGTIKVGGGNLYSGMSPLFAGWSQVRFNPFYRLPWDASAQWGGSWSNYENNIYTNGTIINVNAFDPRYTNGGRTQGVIFQLADMPAGFGLNISYGVDGQTSLYTPNDLTFEDLLPTKKTFGARIYKKNGKHIFGATTIINNGYFENVSSLRESQQMFSGDATLAFNYMTVELEAGATSFSNPYGKYDPDSATTKWTHSSIYDASVQDNFQSGVDLLGRLKVSFEKHKFGFPLAVTFYHLGPYYINSNSGTFNTSTWNSTSQYVQVNGNVSTGWDVAMRRGFIADLGQTANNRRALELTTNLDKGRFKVSIGTQIGQEIQKADSSSRNQVMFYHKLNAWSRASFNYWKPNGGPYRKLLSNFIQLLERVPITDAVIDYRKTFNVFDIEARYKTNFMGKGLILTDYISYQSANDRLSPIPYFTDKAFVRVFYNELIAYYHMYKNTVLVGTAAYHKAVGNDRTELSPENGKPINQQGIGFGLGIDWNFAPMMGLYFREMWTSHSDKNFTRDHFAGFETSLELKVMF